MTKLESRSGGLCSLRPRRVSSITRLSNSIPGFSVLLLQHPTREFQRRIDMISFMYYGRLKMAINFIHLLLSRCGLRFPSF